MKDIKNAISHLNEHQTFPASKAELVETCSGLSDFSADDKKWFSEKLPEGNYKSAEEVIKALGWQKSQSMSDKDAGSYQQR